MCIEDAFFHFFLNLKKFPQIFLAINLIIKRLGLLIVNKVMDLN